LNDVATAAPYALFDDFERTDDSPALFSESSYSYLNRAAGDRFSKIRVLLEDWFAKYPEEHKAEFGARFTTGDLLDRGQFVGAWWELYIYSLYRHLGYSIEIHPELDGVGTRPDFLVTLGDDSMYVECIASTATDAQFTGNPGVAAAIFDAINTLTDNNFFVGVRFKQEGNHQPRRRGIIAGIGNWLKELNPDVVLEDLEGTRAAGELAVLPEKDFVFSDWVITCTAYPKSPGKRGDTARLLGALPPTGAFFVRNVERIRETVRAKGRKYGERGSLDKPLTVAVLSVGSFAEHRDVTDAMFGATAITFAEGDPSSVEWTRRQDGYFRGPGSERGARVSAVLFSNEMQPWSVASHLPAVWLNPWAENRLDSHPPFTTFTVKGNGEIAEIESTTTPRDLFGPSI
jgi:hypothetical protein